VHEYEYVCVHSMCVCVHSICVYIVCVNEYEYVCVSMCVHMCVCVCKCAWTLMRRWICYTYMCECTLVMPTISA